MMKLTSLFLVLVAQTIAYSPAPNRSSNRIIVGGNFGTIDNLARTFRAYGKIEMISLHEQQNSVTPFAFVTFVKPEDAEAALQHESPELDIKATQPMVEHRSRRPVKQWEEMMNLAHKSNTVVQVPKNQLTRVTDYCTNELEGVQVIGALDASQSLSSKAKHRHQQPTSMLYIKATDHEEVVDTLHDDPFVRYNKLFPSLNNLVRGSIFDLAEQAWSTGDQQILSNLPSWATVRVQVFPPSLQNSVLRALEEFRPPDNGLRISSTDYTHVCSVMGLTAEGSDDRGGVYMVGISEPASPLSKTSRTDAYSNLQEIFGRMIHNNRPVQTRTALDCGSGGWSKYLAEDVGVDRVYSVDDDTSSLDPSSPDLKAIHKLPMKMHDALDYLTATGTAVDIYVSDKGLPTGWQVDHLLAARDAGVVTSGTTFVLTLKAGSYMESQVADLRSIAKGVQVGHLFSHSPDERTVVGTML